MRNQSYEQALNRHGLEGQWEYIPSIPLMSIDVNKSLGNQARLLTPINDELVSSYQIVDREGCEFPALVVWRPLGDKKKYILIDGNQRLTAKLRNKRDVTDVYYVKSVDPKVIDRITWTFNNLVNGKRLTQEESIEHAISFVRKYGTTIKEAATEWGLSAHLLAEKVRIVEAKATLNKNNVKITPALSDTTIKVLDTLNEVGEDLFVKAAQTVAIVGATRDDAEDLVRDVKRARTVEEKSKIVEVFAASEKMLERKAETRNGRVPVRKGEPRDKFANLLKQLRNIMEDYDESALRAPSAERKQQMEIALDVVQRLTTMYGLGVVPQGK